jgi:hypothetical protein
MMTSERWKMKDGIEKGIDGKHCGGQWLPNH